MKWAPVSMPLSAVISTALRAHSKLWPRLMWRRVLSWQDSMPYSTTTMGAVRVSGTGAWTVGPGACRRDLCHPERARPDAKPAR